MISMWDLTDLVQLCELRRVPREATHMPPLRNSYSATRYYRHDMSTTAHATPPETPVAASTRIQTASVEMHTVNIRADGKSESGDVVACTFTAREADGTPASEGRCPPA